ncbi:NXPE family member 4-like isoform X3 [Branchiostoma lanceolatum]|uniref:NXPE family member 4-like isoform X3 n=1 Tax=Branchiostoma lanceolatum TaxID=7740 RepID=UPI003456D971
MMTIARPSAALFVVTVLIYMATLKFSYQRLLTWVRDATVPKPLLKAHLMKSPVNPLLIELDEVQPCLPYQPLLVDQVTYPKYTEIVVLNRDRRYRRGDVLTVRVVARDKKRRPKTYGGDFFRARLISSDRSPKASSPGRVTDHCNGTYTVQFPLYWVGNVLIKIQLVHPSEAVNILQRVREIPNKRLFYCAFVDFKTKATEKRECYISANPSLSPRQLCDFSKQKANGTWICQKPEKVLCSSIDWCHHGPWDGDESRRRTAGLLSKKERALFQKPYIEAELDSKGTIRVLDPERQAPQHLPSCTMDARKSQASFGTSLGHWSGKVWTSSACNVRVFIKEDIQRCLTNKSVYMKGDSTIRQWYLRLQEVVPLKATTDSDPAFDRRGDNSEGNISVRQEFHGFPRPGSHQVVFNHARYTVEMVDAIQGDPNTIIVVGLWAHFTAEPLGVFRSRMYAIRGAIHRLMRRSPGTRVFVRTGTTREHEGGKLSYYLLGSDWLANQITEVIREMFRADPDVVVLDTWDMSVCQPGKDAIHPDQAMVDSQLNIMLSHICPT